MVFNDIFWMIHAVFLDRQDVYPLRFGTLNKLFEPAKRTKCPSIEGANDGVSTTVDEMFLRSFWWC